MKKEILSVPGAPAAIGPYSQAVRAGELVFTSGQIPIDPATGAAVEGDVRAQAGRALENLKTVLEGSGSCLERVVKTTLFLKSMADFPAVNEVYGAFFSQEPPARATVEVAALPKGVLVEIEAVALVKEG